MDRLKGDARDKRDPGIEDGKVMSGSTGEAFWRQSAQCFDHAGFHIRFNQHFTQKHEHADGVGEEGEDLERKLCAVQKIVNRYYHSKVNCNHLREPRYFVFGGRAREIEKIEFRHNAPFLEGSTMFGNTPPRARGAHTGAALSQCCVWGRVAQSALTLTKLLGIR